MPANSIKMYNSHPFYLYANDLIDRVRLRGSWTTGNHQEVMVTLKNDVQVRISRSNGTDTFQIGAEEDGMSRNPMTTLRDYYPRNGITCRSAFDAFGEIHRAFPNYEQADCHQFAQNVIGKLWPQAQAELPELQEPDFM